VLWTAASHQQTGGGWNDNVDKAKPLVWPVFRVSLRDLTLLAGNKNDI